MIEFFIAESDVVKCRFIVYSMGQSDLFGFRCETLQQCLNSPGFVLARAFPKQRSRLFGSALLNQSGIETFLESQPTPCDASRIPGLSRLPAVSISRLECRLRISGLSRFESCVVCHWIYLEFVSAGHLWMWVQRPPGWIPGAFETCPSARFLPCSSEQLPKVRKTMITRLGSTSVGLGTCLVCASFGSTHLQNADSARCCRFRNSQQKRASDLDLSLWWMVGRVVLLYALRQLPVRQVPVYPLVAFPLAR